MSAIHHTKPLVLIVDDDPWIQGIAQEFLEDEGFAVVSASDGAAGLELVERLRPTVILLDIALPGMSGSEFLERVRDHASLWRTPVIVISGGVESLSGTLTTQVGCVLPKPFDLAELISEVQAAATAGAHR